MLVVPSVYRRDGGGLSSRGRSVLVVPSAYRRDGGGGSFLVVPSAYRRGGGGVSVLVVPWPAAGGGSEVLPAWEALLLPPLTWQCSCARINRLRLATKKGMKTVMMRAKLAMTRMS